jgi:L-ascorbate metabolism protein UlaG (beta-lactamase superfamily)
MRVMKWIAVSIFATLFVTGTCIAQDDTLHTDVGTLVIHPVSHATFVMSAGNKTIYVDPTGGKSAFNGVKPPDLILVTDIHGDHHDQKTIDSVKMPNTIIVAPKAVAEKMGNTSKSRIIVLKNGDQTKQLIFGIRAVPMYNLPESDTTRHTKGRGNGYVVTIGGKNIYISGDTEDIPEMRQLKNIDAAFVCMNLPYTMDIKQAASAVAEFKPRIVYPYHYRGQGGLSDVDAFKKMVNDSDSGIDVRLLKWY